MVYPMGAVAVLCPDCVAVCMSVCGVCVRPAAGPSSLPQSPDRPAGRSHAPQSVHLSVCWPAGRGAASAVTCRGPEGADGSSVLLKPFSDHRATEPVYRRTHTTPGYSRLCVPPAVSWWNLSCSPGSLSELGVWLVRDNIKLCTPPPYTQELLKDTFYKHTQYPYRRADQVNSVDISAVLLPEEQLWSAVELTAG